MTTLTRVQARKLAQEATALADWIVVRDFAAQMYGEGKAVKVEFECYGEYNDEGGSDYRIESITAYDKDGNDLNFDYTLAFFETEIWKETAEMVEEDEDEENDGEDGKDHSEDFRRLREAYIPYREKENGKAWILLEDLPTDRGSETYDLTVQPSLSLPS